MEKLLQVQGSLSRFLSVILPALHLSRERFSKVQHTISNEEHLPVAEAERSHCDIGKLLRRALRIKVAGDSLDGSGPWVDILDVYASTFVYMLRGAYFQAPYSIDEAGAVTIGASTEVIATVVYTPTAAPPAVIPPAVSESPAAVAESQQGEILGDIVPLDEASAEPFSGSGEIRESSALIRVATPGWGTSGYYPKEVLKRDGPRVFPAGTQMFWNHPTATEEAERPEGDLHQLAAVTTSPARWMESGPKGAGLYTEAALRSNFAPHVAELKNDIGVSMRAFGRWAPGKAEGREGVIIQALEAGKSIDFVTRAGRGGAVLEIFESAGRRASAQPSTAADSRNEQENQNMPMNETELRQLQEATAAATQASTAALAANAEVVKLRTQLLQMNARTFVNTVCEGFAMPLNVKARIVEAMSQNPIVKDGEIDAAAFSEAIKAKIQSELAYISEAAGSPVRNFGSTAAPEAENTTKVTLKEAEAGLDAALAELIG